MSDFSEVAESCPFRSVGCKGVMIIEEDLSYRVTDESEMLVSNNASTKKGTRMEPAPEPAPLKRRLVPVHPPWKHHGDDDGDDALSEEGVKERQIAPAGKPA